MVSLFEERLEHIQKNAKGWTVLSSGEYDHSEPGVYDYTHFESAFIADEVRKHPGDLLLDIGSYYHFVLGLSGCFKNVISIDCRLYGGPRPRNLTHLVCDASKLPLPDGVFSMIISQCTLEHIGLGCYGDPFDWSGDHLAVEEMKRVLQPGGFLIITTTIANTEFPVVTFNVHRIYNFDIIRQYFEGLKLCCEAFFNLIEKRIISKEEVTTVEGGFDVYGSCWQKVV